MHCFPASEIRALHPAIDEFDAVRKMYDPDGLFLNGSLAPLFN